LIEVTTQAALDKALKKTDGGKKELVVCQGKGRFVVGESASVEAWESASVEARGSASVVARESASVEARESASVEAWESASVEARESASVEARGSASVRAFMRSQIKASKSAVVMQHSAEAKIKGGRILDMKPPATAAEWCDFHGVEVRKGGGLNRKLAGQDVAILFKALHGRFESRQGFTYVPGSTPVAPDWDSGKRECGGGLHFSPHPKMAKEFNRRPEHFVACPVLVSEIVVHPDGVYPQKVKAPGCCAPVWEVDANGERFDRAEAQG
jgi:hypothetical protein